MILSHRRGAARARTGQTPLRIAGAFAARLTLTSILAIALLPLSALAENPEGVAPSTPTPTPTGSEIFVATIDGGINPATADYLISSIERAEEEGAAALLIELDTPGGLVSSTQDIIQKILNARVPIIVHVTPSGAWAASAGTFITLAANVAVMAPGTTIGAAHPVSALPSAPEQPAQPASPFNPGGDTGDAKKNANSDGASAARSQQDVVSEKIENFLTAYVESIAEKRHRNVEWAASAVRNSVAVTAEEALELNVIDFVAEGRAALIEAIEGTVVQLGDGKGEVTLALTGAPFVELPMTPVQTIFSFLADPNVAFVLLVLGALGLYAEFQAPGTFVPGILGVCCLVLAAFSFQILPFSGIGLMLLFAGLALLIAELFVVSFGILFALGMGCFLLGGMMVFERPEMSDLTVSFWEVLLPIAAAMTLIGAGLAALIGRSLLLQPTSGVDEMIGLVGRSESAASDDSGRLKVFVRGEYWNAVSETPVDAGAAVEIVAVEGLTLRVRPAQAKAAAVKQA